MACTSASRLASLAAPSRIGFLEADGHRLDLPCDALATIVVAPFQKSPDDQHALLSGRRLVPSRHIARRSIVVPLLELMGGPMLFVQHKMLHRLRMTSRGSCTRFSE